MREKRGAGANASRGRCVEKESGGRAKRVSRAKDEERFELNVVVSNDV